MDGSMINCVTNVEMFHHFSVLCFQKTTLEAGEAGEAGERGWHRENDKGRLIFYFVSVRLIFGSRVVKRLLSLMHRKKLILQGHLWCLKVQV